MPIRKKLAVVAAVGMLAGGASFIGAIPASAIQRAPCNTQNVEVFNADPACFAYAGGMGVTLYQSVGVKGGINAGFVRKSTGANVEYNRNVKNFSSVTVNYVAIY